jgi:hypothetical protein
MFNNDFFLAQNVRACWNSQDPELTLRTLSGPWTIWFWCPRIFTEGLENGAHSSTQWELVDIQERDIAAIVRIFYHNYDP